MAKVNWGMLPAGMPNGDILPHTSAKMRTNMIDQVFFHIGGAERFADWADKNPTEFYKMYARGAVRASSQELNVGEGVEALLARLDEDANIIEGECEVVSEGD